MSAAHATTSAKLMNALSGSQGANLKRAIVIFGLAYVLKRFTDFMRWRGRLLKAYPGSKSPSLVLGDLRELMNSGGFGEEFFIKLHEDHGEFARFFLGPTIVNFSTCNPAHVAELYKKTSSRPFETYIFLSFLGKENLLFQHGAMVKQLRLRYGRMISNVDQLRKVNEVSFREFGDLHRTWSIERRPDGLDVHFAVGPYIYDIMGQVLFGGSWTTSDIGQRIMANHKYLIKWINTWMFWPFPPYFLSKYREFIATKKEWRQLCEHLLEERKANMPAKWEKDDSALTLLLTSKDETGKPFFTRELAISTMCGFLNGAYDTTHATLYWATFNLARYPHVQEKLRRELQSALGSRTECSLDELRSFEYLDAFMKESMRFSPTVPVNQRVNYEEDITIGGWTIPKGTNVNVPMRKTFQSPEYFGHDALQFRPERFMADDPIHQTAREKLTAFGGYTRLCIGEVFAKGEFKAYIISLVQRYNITFVNPDTVSSQAYVEAGVNQPKHKALFRFAPVDSVEEVDAAQNLSWWTSPSPKSVSSSR
eukprot:CAMPEP_0202092910 /NCGR_PEP_ID=MMETSP0964-20121228/48272_1 /ASSEMBLY_ACC=CAM_ASM_000500 /TAXON_ID=4773 /ORGANISM="Schizochytrium aggregatum, Strain ATCC28209" /LENGTH=536 /DNA_ID=CAMNT_0048661155 /DNA_START=57 /DNA_END=1670 /DNA_ORIENTATION=+